MSDDALATYFANLEKNTGRSYESWLELARATGIAKPKALCDHLKAEHGLTHGYANMVALKALGTDAGSSDEATLDRVAGTRHLSTTASLDTLLAGWILGRRLARDRPGHSVQPELWG